jgi:ABC-type sugar transport system ATPase subunit
MRREFIRIDHGRSDPEKQRNVYSVFVHAYVQETYGIISYDIESAAILKDVLCGRETLKSGFLSYREEACEPERFRELMREKVVLIGRKPFFSEELSIADNMFIAMQMKGILHRKKEKQILGALLKRFDVTVSLNRAVSDLSDFELYQLEFLQAYLEGKEGIVVDFENWNTTYSEFLQLTVLVRNLEHCGMTFIWLDGSASRAAQLCNAAMILYKGKTVRMLEYGPFSKENFLRAIPDDAEENNALYETNKRGRTVLELVSVGTNRVREINLAFRAGELTAIVFRNMSEAKELLAILRGELNCRGAILLEGSSIREKTYSSRVQAGMCILDDSETLFENMTVYDNICLPRGLKNHDLWRNEKFRRNIIQEIDREIGKGLWNRMVYELSAEQYLKVLYYKWFLYRPDIVFLLNPISTQNDFLKEWIKNMLKRYTRKGISVVLLLDDEWRDEIPVTTMYRLDRTIQKIR